MIKSLTIKGFRSCEDVHLDLAPGVLALVGRNGVGKSNLLLAIDWLAKAATSPNLATDVRADITTELEIGGRTFVYQVVISGLSETVESLDEISSGLRTSVFLRTGEQVNLADGRSLGLGAKTPAITGLLSLLPSRDPIVSTLRPIAAFFGTMAYYPLVTWPVDDAGFIIQRQTYDEWRKTYRPGGQLTASVLMRLLHMWLEQKERLEEVKALLGSGGLGLLDDIQFIPVEVADGPSTFYLLRLRPASGIGGEGKDFGYEQLSDGTRRILRIVVSLIFDERSIMLVEEPEDCVHPEMLRKLIDVIRSYSADRQFVFATHSPEVLDMMAPEEIRLVTAERGATQVRGLSAGEVAQARVFLRESGSLSDFLEPLQGD